MRDVPPLLLSVVGWRQDRVEQQVGRQDALRRQFADVGARHVEVDLAATPELREPNDQALLDAQQVLHHGAELVALQPAGRDALGELDQALSALARVGTADLELLVQQVRHPDQLVFVAAQAVGGQTQAAVERGVRGQLRARVLGNGDQALPDPGRLLLAFGDQAQPVFELHVGVRELHRRLDAAADEIAAGQNAQVAADPAVGLACRPAYLPRRPSSLALATAVGAGGDRSFPLGVCRSSRERRDLWGRTVGDCPPTWSRLAVVRRLSRGWLRRCSGPSGFEARSLRRRNLRSDRLWGESLSSRGLSVGALGRGR